MIKIDAAFLAKALLGLLVLLAALIYVAHKLSGGDWTVTWTAVGAMSSLLAIGLLVIAAILAWNQVFATETRSKLDMTAQVLQSKWWLEASTTLSGIVIGHRNNLDAVRASVEKLLRTYPQDDEKAANYTGQLSQVLAAYIAMALLYNRDALDKDLLIDNVANLCAWTMYVFANVLREQIDNGAYEENLLDLGNACLAVVQKRDRYLTHYPALKDFALRASAAARLRPDERGTSSKIGDLR
jgi:hypothetical protein